MTLKARIKIMLTCCTHRGYWVLRVDNSNKNNFVGRSFVLHNYVPRILQTQTTNDSQRHRDIALHSPNQTQWK